MRKTFLTFCVAALSLFAVSSCYDDTALWSEVDALKTKVESLQNKLNEDVAAINAALAVHIKFQVNPETFEISVSYDNGTTWVATGIYAEDPTEELDEVEVLYEEGSDELTLVVNGTAYAISVYEEDASSIVLGRTDFFLMYGGSKKVELTAEGIADYYVMAKPDGWKTSIDGTTLTVTAPNKAVVALGAAEAEGEVLVHATTVEGKCKVAKVDVKTGDGLTLDIDGKGNVVIKNAYTQVSSSEMGEAALGFANFYFGFATSELTDDPEAFFDVMKEWYETPDWSPYGMFYNLQPFAERQASYVEVENEVDVIETTLDEIYQSIMYEELPYGESFVFWVAPVDSEGTVVSESAVYYPYTHLLHEVEILDITHNDATLSFEVEGAAGYVVSVVDAWFEENGFSVKEYMEQMGEWMYLTNGYAEYLPFVPAGDYTGENAVAVSEIFGEPLSFDTKYYVVVFPYMEGTVYNDYETQFVPYLYSFTTKGLEAGAEYEAEVGDAEVSYTSVSVLVTPEENTTVWYKWYDEYDFEEFATDEEIVEDILNGYYPETLEYEDVLVNSGMEPGSVAYLALLSVGEDGKYGPLQVEEYKSKALPTTVDETLTVALGEGTATYSSITVSVEPAANTVVYYNFYSEAMLNNWETDADAAAYVIQHPKGMLTAAADVTASNLAQGQTQVLVAVVLDEENPDSYNVVKKTYKTNSYPYSENITIALNDITYDADAKAGKVVFDVTGDVTSVMFGCYYDGYINNFETGVVTKGQPESYFNPVTVSVVDGKATVEFSAKADWYAIYATAVVTEDGKVTAIANKTYASSIKNALASL